MLAIMVSGQFIKVSTPRSLIASSCDGHLLIVEINPKLEVDDDIVEEESEYSDRSQSDLS